MLLFKPLPQPPITGGDPIHTHIYKTSQVRKERFKKVGSCKSAPQRYSALITSDDIKSCSVTNLLGSSKCSATGLIEGNETVLNSSLASNHDSDQYLVHDPIFLYIQSARKSIGLETNLMQESVDDSATCTLRESLLVSAGPIASIKDLHLLSRRLSNFYTEPSKNRATDKSVTTKLGSDFAYALRRENKKRCNVYDLYITEQDKAKAHGDFYTVSAFSVSEVSVRIFARDSYFFM